MIVVVIVLIGNRLRTFSQTFTKSWMLRKSISKASMNGGSEIPQFTCHELEASIRELKNGKARDGAGVFAELIKNGGPMLVDVLLSLYNQVIAVDAVPPSSWKASIVSVLHKSGERSKAENDRPITIIPLLYKLFALL